MTENEDRQAGNLAAAEEARAASLSAVHHSTNLKKIKIALPDGRKVGSVKGDTFRRMIHSTKHLYKKWPGPGFALACSVLEDAQRAGAAYVELFDAETGKTYRALLADFFTLGADISFPGFQPQRLLNLKYWSDSKSKPTTPTTPNSAGVAEPVADVAQMPLFGGLAL